MAKYTKETDVLFQYSQGFRLIVPNAYKTCHTQFYSVDYPNGLAIAPSSYIVEGGKTYCPVPNQMTVKPNSIIVFAYLLEESRAITESKTVLEVWERPKPPDFVFDPTDTVTYATAAEMIEQMKASVSAEEARVEAESLRVTAEASRVAAEESRAAAESSRVTAEESRVTAEAERESAESSRATAEASRVSAESERETAEALRVSAESSRASAEESRVTAETTRASAEESRVAAESARASTESERVSAESSRATAEASRVSAESSRVSAESERQASESARQSAEETRQTNESARISAEASRASAESSRVSAEASRVSAEALREAKWNNASATAVTGDVNADVVITDSGVVFNFAIPRGLKGDKGDKGDIGDTGNTGNGIASMTLVSGTHAAGTIDTYRLTFTDGTYQDFTVYNGANGEGAGDMLWEEFNNRLNPSGKNGQIAFESEVTAHTGNTDIHVTSEQKTAWSAKYDKPTGGIPKSDFASAVQTSLGKADTALQEHQDISALTNHVANNDIHVTTTEKAAWNLKPELFNIYVSQDRGTGAYYADKTFDEILAAYNAGNILKISLSGSGGIFDSYLESGNRFSFYVPSLRSRVLITSSTITVQYAPTYVPVVNTSDVGKVLTVDSSNTPVWAEATSSGSTGAEVFLVTFTQDEETGNYTIDKTFAEIITAYEAGKIVLGKLSYSTGYSMSYIGQLSTVSGGNGVVFTFNEFPGSGNIHIFMLGANGQIMTISASYYSPEFSQYTILTSGWSGGVYSFESDFPNATYDIEIELDSTATEPQVEAWSSAKVTAVFGTNTMKALGDVPTVDIPVIVKKVIK